MRLSLGGAARLAVPVAGVATGSEDSEGILPVPVPLAIAVPVPVVVVAAEIVAGATASVVATLSHAGGGGRSLSRT